MKKVLVLIVVIFYGFIVCGQDMNRSIPIKFHINDSLICNNTDVIFEFRSIKDTSRVYMTNGKILIPEYCFKYKEVEIKILYQNYIVSKTLQLETLLMNKNVSWNIGFDTRPFKEYTVAHLNIHPNDKLIFFWEATLDEIIEWSVYPIRDNVFDYLFEIEEEPEEE